MENTRNKFQQSHHENQYQVVLNELKSKNADLQEKFEKLSQIGEDEWKDMTSFSEYTYERTPA